MNWFWMNVPLMVVFFVAWTGVPLWLSVRHPDIGPVTLAGSSWADNVVTVEPLPLEAELVVLSTVDLP